MPINLPQFKHSKFTISKLTWLLVAISGICLWYLIYKIFNIYFH